MSIFELLKEHEGHDHFLDYTIFSEFLGYEKKESVIGILKNEMYGFTEGVDYKIINIKSGKKGRSENKLLLTRNTIQEFCLMAKNETGTMMRKYYVEARKYHEKYTPKFIRDKMSIKIPDAIVETEHHFDISPFIGKDVLYLIFLGDGMYKYGITENITKRLSSHEKKLKYKYIVKCWDCGNRTVSVNSEREIKQYLAINNYRETYGPHVETFKTADINKLIEIFDNTIEKYISEFNSQAKIVQTEQEIELAKNNIELTKNLVELAKRGINPIELLNENMRHTHKSMEEYKQELDNLKNELNILKNESIIKRESIVDKIKSERVQCYECSEYKLPDEFENVEDGPNCCIACTKHKSERRTNRKNEIRENNEKRENNKNQNDDGENQEPENEVSQCTKCAKIKSVGEFGKDRNGKIYSWCIGCREKDKKSRQKTIESRKKDIDNGCKLCPQCRQSKALEEYDTKKDGTKFALCIKCRNSKLERAHDVEDPESGTFKCSHCSFFKLPEAFGVKPNGKQYKLCIPCREKDVEFVLKKKEKHQKLDEENEDVEKKVCSRCGKIKNIDEMTNEKTGEIYKKCLYCRQVGRNNDAKRLTRQKGTAEHTADLEKRKEKYKIPEVKDHIRAVQKEYYYENQDDLLAKKRNKKN